MTTTLPASGPISIRDFNEAMEGALGFTPTRNTSLNDPAIRANAKKKTGLISLGDLRGKTVTRTNKPLAVSPAMDGVTYTGKGTGGAGTYAIVWFRIDNSGAITVASNNGTSIGTALFTHYTGNIAAAIGVNHLWQTDITVELLSTTGTGTHSGTVSDVSADPSWTTIAAYVSVAYSTLHAAVYRVTITDKYDASNSLVFTFTQQFLPIWD